MVRIERQEGRRFQELRGGDMQDIERAVPTAHGMKLGQPRRLGHDGRQIAKSRLQMAALKIGLECGQRGQRIRGGDDLAKSGDEFVSEFLKRDS